MNESYGNTHYVDEIQMGKQLRNVKEEHVKKGKLVGALLGVLAVLFFETSYAGLGIITGLPFIVMIVVYCRVLRKYLMYRNAEKYLYRIYPYVRSEVYENKKKTRVSELYSYFAFGAGGALAVLYFFTSLSSGIEAIFGAILVGAVGFLSSGCICLGAKMLLMPKLFCRKKARKTMLKIVDPQNTGSIYIPVRLYPEKEQAMATEAMKANAVRTGSESETESVSKAEQFSVTDQVAAVKDLVVETFDATKNTATASMEAVKTINWFKVGAILAASVVVIGGGAMLLSSGIGGNKGDQVVNNQGNDNDDVVSGIGEENDAESESEVYMTDEERWYNSPESNGKDFELGQDALDIYPEYVKSEKAYTDYQEYVKYTTRFYENPPATIERPVYFSIVSLESDEPFLLMSRDTSSQAVYVMFCVVSNGESNRFLQFVDGMGIIDDRDTHKMYVVTGDSKYRHAKFLIKGGGYVTNTRYGVYDEYIEYCTEWTYWYNDGPWEADSELLDVDENTYVEQQLENNNIAEIKWFHVDDTESARAYYSQFVRDNNADSGDRNAYFSDKSCALGFIKPFNEGVLYESEHRGYKSYEFHSLQETGVHELMRVDNGAAYTFDTTLDGLSSIKVDIFKENGAYRAIVREAYFQEGKGYIFAVYEVDEEATLNMYSYSRYDDDGAEPSSMEELVQRLGAGN